MLLLDGRLGPMSFPFRRAAVSAFVIALTIITVARYGRTWAPWSLTAVLAIVALLWAPNVGIGLAALVVQLAVLEGIVGAPPAIAVPSAGFGAACATYMVVEAAADLVPPMGLGAETVARLGSGYVEYARGVETNLSFTALGGPGTSLASLYLVEPEARRWDQPDYRRGQHPAGMVRLVAGSGARSGGWAERGL